MQLIGSKKSTLSKVDEIYCIYSVYINVTFFWDFQFHDDGIENIAT